VSATEHPILMQLSAAIETALRGKLERASKLLERVNFEQTEGEHREVFQQLCLRIDTMVAQQESTVAKRPEEAEKEKKDLEGLRNRINELRKAHLREQRKANQPVVEEEKPDDDIDEEFEFLTSL